MLIALVGPESCGKTTLARALAEHLSAPVVEEFAREYLELRSIENNYSSDDVLSIAKSQWEREQQALHRNTQNLILDTDLLVIKIWWEQKYGRCHPWILDRLEQQRQRKYLLLSPDIPWHSDPLRENPHDRQCLFETYQQELIVGKCDYTVISGSYSERTDQAIACTAVTSES